MSRTRVSKTRSDRVTVDSPSSDSESSVSEHKTFDVSLLLGEGRAAPSQVRVSDSAPQDRPSDGAPISRPSDLLDTPSDEHVPVQRWDEQSRGIPVFSGSEQPSSRERHEDIPERSNLRSNRRSNIPSAEVSTNRRSNSRSDQPSDSGSLSLKDLETRELRSSRSTATSRSEPSNVSVRVDQLASDMQAMQGTLHQMLSQFKEVAQSLGSKDVGRKKKTRFHSSSDGDPYSSDGSNRRSNVPSAEVGANRRSNRRSNQPSGNVDTNQPPSPRQRNLSLEDEEEEDQYIASQFLRSRADLRDPRPKGKTSKERSAHKGPTLHSKLKGTSGGPPPDEPPSDSEGSSSSSSSPSGSSDDAARRRRHRNRRESLFEHQPMLRPTNNPLVGAVHDGVLRTAPPDDASHVTLNVFSVSAWFRFQYMIHQYQARTGIRLVAAARVSKEVVQRVIA